MIKKTIIKEQLTHNYRLKNYPLRSYKKIFLIDASRVFGKKKNQTLLTNALQAFFWEILVDNFYEKKNYYVHQNFDNFFSQYRQGFTYCQNICVSSLFLFIFSLSK